jgi:hypothetical protein
VSPDTEQESRGLLPVEGRWLSLLFFAGLGVWIALLIYWSLPWNWDNKLFPIMAGSLAVVLILSVVVEYAIPDIYDRLLPDFEFLEDADDEMTERMEETGTVTTRSKAERETYELIMLGWVVALPVLIYYAGFGLVIPIYTLAFGLYFLRDVKMSILMTLLITLFIWLLFVVILNVQLWEGTLGLLDPFDYIPQPI